MYNGQYGVINEILRAVGLGCYAKDFLGTADTAMLAIIFIGVPWVQGINFLLYLTGFMNIPKTHYEAARLEGAKWYQVMKSIEIPTLRPQIFMVLVMAIISHCTVYEPFLVMGKGGGPAGATTTPAYYLFQNAFQYGRFGYACAIGVILFIFCLIITVGLKNLLIRKDV